MPSRKYNILVTVGKKILENRGFNVKLGIEDIKVTKVTNDAIS